MQFALNLKRLRKFFGYSQSSLAAKSHVNLRHLQSIEAGDVSVRSNTAEKLMGAIGVPLCYAFHPNPDLHLAQMGVPCKSELVDRLPFPIGVTDLLGKIVYSNRLHREIFLGSPDREVFAWDFAPTAEDMARSKENFSFFIKNRPQPEPLRRKVKTQDGKIIEVEGHWDYVFDANKVLRGFLWAMIVPSHERLAYNR